MIFSLLHPPDLWLPATGETLGMIEGQRG